jgi:pimeloyl-ACP methyl ester carboxylesterase
MGGRDQRDWEEFARLLAGQGLPAFTLDFRCHGESGCDASTPEAHLADLRAAFGLLRERGYRRIACVGASLGARACISAALYEEMAGLAFLAGVEPGVVEGWEYPRDLVSPDMPKLFVVTEYDPYSAVRTAVPALYEVSPEPRELHIFPGTAHGTELFATEYGEEFRGLVAGFLLRALP